MKPEHPQGIRKGIYVLPNLVTTASLFFGFSAICRAISTALEGEGDYRTCALYVFVAALFDGLDGRVARRTNTASRFGVEYDSLSDLVSFGVAPAVILYLWGLQSLGNAGAVGLFLFVACGAIRLARFNVQSSTDEKIFFQGLPIPMAGMMLMGTVLIWQGLPTRKEYVFVPGDIEWMLLSLTFLLAMLMVSTVPYFSFKKLTFRRRVPIPYVAAFAGLLVIVALHPWWTAYTLGCAYILSGPLYATLFPKRLRDRELSRYTDVSQGHRTTTLISEKRHGSHHS